MLLNNGKLKVKDFWTLLDSQSSQCNSHFESKYKNDKSFMDIWTSHQILEKLKARFTQFFVHNFRGKNFSFLFFNRPIALFQFPKLSDLSTILLMQLNKNAQLRKCLDCSVRIKTVNQQIHQFVWFGVASKWQKRLRPARTKIRGSTFWRKGGGSELVQLSKLNICKWPKGWRLWKLVSSTLDKFFLVYANKSLLLIIYFLEKMFKQRVKCHNFARDLEQLLVYANGRW